MNGSEVVAKARALIEEGHTWQARDLLVDHLEEERDAPALTLLGHVHHGMGDLPRAGAAWFATGLRGPEADAAVAAWREQSADDFAVMWRSIPATFRAEPRPPRLEALRTRALTSDPDLDKPASPLLPDGAGPDALVGAREADQEAPGLDGAQVIGWILAAVFVVCAVIGAVTILNWLVPHG